MDATRQAVAIGFVLVLLWSVARLLRRAGITPGIRLPRKAAKTIEIVERVPLTPHHSLHLLRVGSRSLVLGAHAAGFSVICELPAANSIEP